MQVWPEIVENVQLFLCAGFVCGGSINIYIQRYFVFALNLSSSGCSHVGSLFTIEESKWVGLNVTCLILLRHIMIIKISKAPHLI